MFESLNPAARFLAAAARHPDNTAISAMRRETTYGELARRVAHLAGHLAPRLRSGRVGVLATRSVEAYVGILAAGMAGATYVPLSLKWPPARLRQLLDILDLDALVADANGAALLTPEVLDAAPRSIVVPDDAAGLPADDPRIARFSALPEAPLAAPTPMDADDIAYIIFTSGTTGLPKGVVISAGSLAAYLERARPWTRLTPGDRVAEAHDVTFDLSVHNLFLTLESGAALHLMSALELMAPQHFIRSRRITAWMSVPTIANMMRTTGALKPGLFDSVRLSIFCGEPLPAATAAAWAAATPNGVVENIYGPTECTVVVMRQTFGPDAPVTPGRGVLAVGLPFDGVKAAVLGPDLRPVPDGTPGEIAIGGPQVGVGYFASPAQTADRFRSIAGERWYLTGDLGMRDADGVFHHLGRTDNQVKVKGNRIELEEVEAHLRAASGSESVAVVAWPVVDGAAQGLVGFVGGVAGDADEVRARMAADLPRAMIPETIRFQDALPVNINGKVDRRALRAGLEEAAGELVGA